MGNFSDFIKNNSFKKEESMNKKENIKNVDENVNKENLENLINKYSNYSNDQLLNEFIKMTLEKKRKGELNQNDIMNIKNTIMPYLSQEQINELNKILEMVNHV